MEDFIIFEVKRINYRNEKSTYTVLTGQVKNKIINNKKNIITIVGKFPFVLEKDEFETKGIWHTHKIYGKQFIVTDIKRKYPETIKGIKEFLVNIVKGLGKRTVEKIVETYGLDTLDVIKRDHTSLLSVKGIGEEKALKIKKEIIKHKIFEDLLTFNKSINLNYETTLKIYRKYEELSLATIVTSPYSIDIIDFKYRERIAKSFNVPYNNKERIKYGIIYWLYNDIKSNGNMFMELQILLNTLNDGLLQIGEYSERLTQEEIMEGIDELLNENKIILDQNAVYIEKYYKIEEKIINLVRKKIKKLSDVNLESFFNNYNKISLAEKQKEAVYMALTNNISILTGKPGTGKTQTINTIIEALSFLNPNAEIHLLAPTGRASMRMAELTQKEAKTIHRAIGLNFHNDETEELMGDIVIVDESSMIDSYLFLKLLESVNDNTKLLLVGDYNQLPSVGAGNVLQELINSGKIPTVTLTEIFRQSQQSNIVINAHKISNGETNLLLNSKDKQDFFFIEKENPNDIKNIIIQKIESLIKKKWFTLNDIQILTPMWRGDLGADEFNTIIQEKLNPNKKEIILSNKKRFKLYDRVIHTVNNYDLNVFNGEIGYITEIRDYENSITVKYPNKEVVYDFDLELEEQIELAYAITVHKSQGSEFPCVIMPIHDTQKNMLYRSLIYTGVTRSKKMVLLVGNKECLNYGIKNVNNFKRNSKLLEKLKQG